MLKKFLVLYIFHIEIIMYIKKLTVLSILDWIRYEEIEMTAGTLRVTFCKNDTKSSNLIFDPLRFCSCLVKILVLVRN